MDERTALQMLGIMDAIYPMLKTLPSPEALVSLIGCIIDQYAADNKIPYEQMHTVVEGLPSAHEFAHNLLGDAEPV